MRVIEISSPGPADVLRVAERPDPVAGSGEVVIAIEAAGVNRPDLMQREGHYPPPKGATDIPGLEAAGRIISLGPGEPRSATGRVWKIGDEVCALLPGGGYSDRVAVAGLCCLPIPDGLSMEQAAALPETFFTVWTNVFDRGRLTSGEWLLVHGGTSGIGTTAAINYRTNDFVERVKAITDNRGVDVILDIIGGDYTAKNLLCLARDGRLVQIGLMGGANAAISLTPILLKRLTITGSTLRVRTPEEKGAIAASLEREIWPLIASGAIKPVVHATFPLADAAAAHRLLESGQVVGKVVLRNTITSATAV